MESAGSNFAEQHQDAQLPQTTFLGWRDDEKPEEVVSYWSSDVLFILFTEENLKGLEI
jgi:hypothetical protein